MAAVKQRLTAVIPAGKLRSSLRSLALLVAVTANSALYAATGDPARGAQLYAARCGACHSIDDNGAGPRHRGLFGRRAGTQQGFDYSEALKRSKIVWNERTLDRWLQNPSALIPGNKMVVQLASDPRDRADLIAYLKRATVDKHPGGG
jgi:cytochrome c